MPNYISREGVEVAIKDQPPGEGWPQYGEPVKTEYGHSVEVFMSSIAFEPHCWLRIFDADGAMKIDPVTISPDAGCDVMAHLTYWQAVAIRDRLTAFIEDPGWQLKGWAVPPPDEASR